METPWSPDWPELTFPAAEAEVVKSHYDKANVILEYGSGGSTFYAARQPGKSIFSVESDQDWARDINKKLSDHSLPGRAIVHHVDIGPVGPWGRPCDDRAWRKFHQYPVGIWTEDFFQQPEVVLIDGRFRPACFLATALLTRSMVTVLFDDYYNRPRYAQVEEFARPIQRVGRLAVFQVEPLALSPILLLRFLEMCAQPTFPGAADYGELPLKTRGESPDTNRR